MNQPLHAIEVQTLEGQSKTLEEYRGSVLLIVNTASKCGYTPQLDGLQKLYEKYQDRGLVVLGFPCNQFLKQEPGSESEIGAFCQKNYGVSFPMHSKIKVNGADRPPPLQEAQEGSARHLRDRDDQVELHQVPRRSGGQRGQALRDPHLPKDMAKDIEALLPA